ncbi:anti-sigma factor family protein [Calycomorphotria hydatis]|uniref:Zinc-finger domain-containing protein n=1 Tax=Calycomorphotria hydatis TaxID=2528027 RepID=A0A517TDY7_9PLAN|nr:hypothetical protein [Calycomorphotria hydatis]QDT66589.1 hypothetical protein V22_38590 [Calycomorphotria hydatis]
MNKLKRLTSEQREDLVAYLDGELDERRTRELDQVLAASEVARHEVEMLSRTWLLLESLPQVTASNDFANRTVSSVRVQEQPNNEVARLAGESIRRVGITTIWLASAAAAAVIGFMLTSEWLPSPHGRLLEDLPIVEDLDLYSEIGSVEFLQALEASKVLDEMPLPSDENAGGNR